MRQHAQNLPPQNQAEFDEKYEQLTSRNKEILRHFLDGHTDEEIKEMTFGTKDNVRYHLSAVCGTFGLKEKQEKGEKPERSSHRKDLVDLFMQFRTNLVSEGRAKGAGYQPQKNRPVLADMPGRQMDLQSIFYVKPSLEDRCCEEVLRPGQLIRIRAPQMSGKTSLLYRILHAGQKSGYAAISLNLRYDADEIAMGSLATFLTWFCQEIAAYLELPIENLPTTKAACNTYFQKQVLPQIDTPLVIALDEVEVLFEYPDIAREFFAMLRGWHEKAKSPGVGMIWERLRLVIVHSTDDYIRLNVAQSPFKNIGHIAWPKPLLIDQVQVLAQRYGLQQSMDFVGPLMELVGGHPYLVQQALFTLWQKETTGAALLKNAPTSSGIYRGHFHDLVAKLQSTIGQPVDLVAALNKVLQVKDEAKLSLEEVFKLEGLGLVQTQNNQARISCELYRQFFQAWL
jgi:DNA-binding CsgD family transcriptional regulator